MTAVSSDGEDKEEYRSTMARVAFDSSSLCLLTLEVVSA